jgi:hypothetical protein
VASLFSHIFVPAAAAILLARLLLFFFPSGLPLLPAGERNKNIVPLNSVDVASPIRMAREKDPNTASNVDAFIVKHCHYDWIVDFERVSWLTWGCRFRDASISCFFAVINQKIIRGHVDHDVETVQAASEIILDTSALNIKTASLVDGNATVPLTFTLGDSSIYGRALTISLGDKAPSREVG